MMHLWKNIEKMILSLSGFGLKLLGKELTDDMATVIIQFVKFALVGASNAVVNYLTYAAVLVVLQRAGLVDHTGYLLAQVAAFAISVLWSFIWNSKIVFTTQKEEKRSVGKALLKTYIAYSFTGLLLNSILLLLWIDVFHMSEFVAPIINIIINVPLNFIINKYWTFGQKR